MRSIFAFASLAILSACVSPPAESVSNVDDRPSILIRNAPIGAKLFLDGLEFGFTGKDTMVIDFERPFLVEPGTHVVRIEGLMGGAYSEKVFVSGRGTRTVVIPDGAVK